MKNMMCSFLLLSITIFSMISAGCLFSSEKNKIKKGLPGTYIRYSEHEFGSEWDTLTITENRNLMRYQILRRWKYERVLDGRRIHPEYKRQSASAVFDENSHVLKDTETGDAYSFDITKKTVSTGETIYKKIN